jgi:hypothetical protein
MDSELLATVLVGPQVLTNTLSREYHDQSGALRCLVRPRLASLLPSCWLASYQVPLRAGRTRTSSSFTPTPFCPARLTPSFHHASDGYTYCYRVNPIGIIAGSIACKSSLPLLIDQYSSLLTEPCQSFFSSPWPSSCASVADGALPVQTKPSYNRHTKSRTQTKIPTVSRRRVSHHRRASRLRVSLHRRSPLSVSHPRRSPRSTRPRCTTASLPRT